MCGICGAASVNPDSQIDKEMLFQMTNIMTHRGPDGEGFHREPGIGLGFRRLSIIDLIKGNQPIYSEDKSIAIICNGEIYNYIELQKILIDKGHQLRTDSDTEVIVHLYEEYGVQCLEHLRGMFAFALWDTQKRQLMLARDRLGIKPLHYALVSDGLYFASEQKSILAAEKIERRMDVHSLFNIFSLGFVRGEKTLFTQIRRLLPGHYLLFQAGNVSIHRYWKPDFESYRGANSKVSVEEWSQTLLEHLKESVRLHMRSDVEVGAWLSAGIDSSAVAALMRLYTNRPIQAFSLTFEDPFFDEVSSQKTLDQFPEYGIVSHRFHFTAKHFELLPRSLWHNENPCTGGIDLCRMLLSELTSNHVKVVLTGEGSDELLGGYPWYRRCKRLVPFSVLPEFLRRLIVKSSFVRKRWPTGSRLLVGSQEMDLQRFIISIGGADLPTVFDRLFTDDIKQTIPKGTALLPDDEKPDHFHQWHPFTQLQYYDINVRLADFLVHDLDRASMACSLEARVPFLDHKLVEFCLQAPPSVKLRGLEEKYILRKAMQKHLPRVIYTRKKQGLWTPYFKWMKEVQPDFVLALLSEKSLKEKGYFNPAFVSRMFTQYKAGTGRWGRLLYCILLVQLWDDIFLKKNLQR